MKLKRLATTFALVAAAALLDAIYDMAGDVSEYVNNCRIDPVFQELRCADRGSRLGTDDLTCASACPSPHNGTGDAWGRPEYLQSTIGIRCCA